MAVDTYLQLQGVTGESTRKGYEGWIEVESFDFDVVQVLNIGSQSSGAGAGKVTFNPFSITKRNDSSSPVLFQNCCSGTSFKTAKIVAMKAGGDNPVKFLTYEFALVAVKSIEYSVALGSETPLESVAFEYGALNVTYTPQKADGSAGSPVVAGWSRVTNSKL